MFVVGSVTFRWRKAWAISQRASNEPLFVMLGSCCWRGVSEMKAHTLTQKSCQRPFFPPSSGHNESGCPRSAVLFKSLYVVVSQHVSCAVVHSVACLLVVMCVRVMCVGVMCVGNWFCGESAQRCRRSFF